MADLFIKSMNPTQEIFTGYQCCMDLGKFNKLSAPQLDSQGFICVSNSDKNTATESALPTGVPSALLFKSVSPWIVNKLNDVAVGADHGVVVDKSTPDASGNSYVTITPVANASVPYTLQVDYDITFSVTNVANNGPFYIEFDLLQGTPVSFTSVGLNSSTLQFTALPIVGEDFTKSGRIYLENFSNATQPVVFGATNLSINGGANPPQLGVSVMSMTVTAKLVMPNAS